MLSSSLSTLDSRLSTCVSVIHPIHKPSPRHPLAIQPIDAAVAELGVVVVARVAAVAPPFSLHAPGAGGVHDAAGESVSAHEVGSIAFAEHLYRLWRTQSA